MGDKSKKYGPEEKRMHRDKGFREDRNAKIAKGGEKIVHRHEKGK